RYRRAAYEGKCGFNPADSSAEHRLIEHKLDRGVPACRRRKPQVQDESCIPFTETTPRVKAEIDETNFRRIVVRWYRAFAHETDHSLAGVRDRQRRRGRLCRDAV